MKLIRFFLGDFKISFFGQVQSAFPLRAIFAVEEVRRQPLSWQISLSR